MLSNFFWLLFTCTIGWLGVRCEETGLLVWWEGLRSTGCTYIHIRAPILLLTNKHLSNIHSPPCPPPAHTLTHRDVQLAVDGFTQQQLAGSGPVPATAAAVGSLGGAGHASGPGSASGLPFSMDSVKSRRWGTVVLEAYSSSLFIIFTSCHFRSLSFSSRAFPLFALQQQGQQGD